MKRLLVCIVALAATGCTSQTVVQEPLPTQETSSVATAEPTLPRPAPVVPEDFRLWKFRAPIVKISLDGNALVPPDDPSIVGWWGKRAGARKGVTLLTGHTVHSGGGELDDLEHTPVGSLAVVSGVRYRVTSVRVISKPRLAEEAPRLFSQTGKHRLVVVTCEGYNPATGQHDDNVVVVAEPEKPF